MAMTKPAAVMSGGNDRGLAGSIAGDSERRPVKAPSKPHRMRINGLTAGFEGRP
jgi:hypothetical protein